MSSQREKWRKQSSSSNEHFYLFQLSCIQLPAKGFSCDKKGCRILKRDTVGLRLFSGSWIRNPCPFFSWGHSSSPGDGEPLSQQVVLLSQTLILNCHKSIPTLMLRLLLPCLPFQPFLLTVTAAQDPLTLLNPSLDAASRKSKVPAPDTTGCGQCCDLTLHKNSLKKKFSSVYVCTHTCLLFYFIFLFNWN